MVGKKGVDADVQVDVITKLLAFAEGLELEPWG